MARPRGTPFPEGNKEGHGGARKDAGRKPGWFKTECDRILDDSKCLLWMEKVIRGDDVKIHVTQMGDKVEVPADVKERLMAIEMIKEWSTVGKTPLPVRATNEDGEDVGGVIFLPVQSHGKAGTIIKQKRERSEGRE